MLDEWAFAAGCDPENDIGGTAAQYPFSIRRPIIRVIGVSVVEQHPRFGSIETAHHQYGLSLP
jgi:hypothetical protein